MGTPAHELSDIMVDAVRDVIADHCDEMGGLNTVRVMEALSDCALDFVAIHNDKDHILRLIGYMQAYIIHHTYKLLAADGHEMRDVELDLDQASMDMMEEVRKEAGLAEETRFH